MQDITDRLTEYEALEIIAPVDYREADKELKEINSIERELNLL